MKKAKSVAFLLFFICSLVLLGTVIAFGIPFQDVPSLFDCEQMNFSRDFSTGYQIPIQSNHKTVSTVQARVYAMPYEGVELTVHEDGTSSLYLPKQFGAASGALASTVCASGVITFTDQDGSEVIPRKAIRAASVGVGRMDPNSSTLHYYLEFFLEDSYREQFYEATEQLAAQASKGKNILVVRLDGAGILQASVEEPMSEESFMIGGNFADATLPTLYASFINGGSFSEPLAYGDTVSVSPTLGENAFLIFFFSLFAISAFLSILSIFKGRYFFTANLITPMFYLGTAFVLYQLFKIHLSIFSLLGILIGLLFQFAILLSSESVIRKAALHTKPLEASIHAGVRNHLPKFIVLHLIFIVICAFMLIFGANQMHLFDCTIPLMIACIFSAFFSLTSHLFWHSFQSIHHTLTLQDLGIVNKASKQ